MVNLVWAIAILLALVGAALIAYSAWKPIRTWRRRGKACQRCGYPIPRGAASSPARCPECGTEYASRRSPVRAAIACVFDVVRVVVAVVLLAPLAMLIWPFRASQVLEPLFVTWTESSRTELGTGTFVQEEMAFRAEVLNRASQELQRFNIYVGMEAGSLQRARLIDRAGRVAFETEGRAVQLGSPFPSVTNALKAPGEFTAVDPGLDIDADGVPDMIVSTFSGGAHCCWEYAVIALSDPPRVTFQMDSAVGARFTLDPAERGNTTLIETADTTWAYWHTSYVESPMPRVTMRLEHGQTTIEASAMRAPAPPSEDIAVLAIQVRDEIRAEMAANGAANAAATGVANGVKELSTADYWRTPLELMYTGHEDLAWKFFDDAWPEGVAGKDAFLAEFRQLADQSAYWPRVKAAFGAE